MTSESLTLSKPWAGYDTGTILRVLAAGDRYDGPDPSIDVGRAAWLRAEGFAEAEEVEAKTDAPKRKGGGRKKKGDADGD